MSKLSNDKKEEIRSIINILEEKHSISNNEDPFKLISELENFIIIRFPGNEDLSGITLKKQEYKCIYINSIHVLGRQYFSLWHEFYHSINDTDKNIYINCGEADMEEKEADYFASNILLPEMKVKDYISILRKDIKDMDEYDLVTMQYSFKVSLQCLIFRLNEIYNTKIFFNYKYLSKIENRFKYESIVADLNYNTELISPTNDYCVPGSFLQELKYNLKNDRISLSKANKILEQIEQKGVNMLW